MEKPARDEVGRDEVSITVQATVLYKATNSRSVRKEFIMPV
jgi:hypothetical protein